MSEARASDENDPYAAVCPVGKWRGFTIAEILARMSRDEAERWLAWTCGSDTAYEYQSAARRVREDRRGDRRRGERRQGERRGMHRMIGEALDVWHDDDGVWRQVGSRTLGPFTSEAEAEAEES